MVLKKIGLTGATGMLGRHVRAALEDAGAEIISVSRERKEDKEANSWDLSNWRKLDELDHLFADVQAVIHVGAMVQTNGQVDEGLMFNTNVRSCLNLGQWALCREVAVVHISSSTVYANISSNNISEDAQLGYNGLGGFYGLSKLLAEDVFTRLEQQGLKLAIVRPTSIYGYGLPIDKMISHFLAKAREGGVIELVPPVNDKIDFVHAADVALSILAILKTEAWDTFNIASGHLVTIKELAQACVSVTGRGSILINENTAQMRNPITRFALNTKRAKNQLGWEPKFDIQQGLKLIMQECSNVGSH